MADSQLVDGNFHGATFAVGQRNHAVLQVVEQRALHEMLAESVFERIVEVVSRQLDNVARPGWNTGGQEA